MAHKAALLLVDFINPLDFPRGEQLGTLAVPAARATARLKRRCKRAGWPCIYTNDNFGRWTSQFDGVVDACRQAGGAPATLAELLAPEPDDITLLKPRHSAFYGTALEFLLGDANITILVMTGIAADSCVLFTALDAFLRKYMVWVPRDCTASEIADRKRAALQQMRAAAKVWTGPSTTALSTAVARCRQLHKTRSAGTA